MKRAQFLSLVGVSLAIGLIAISPARAQQQPLPVQPAPSSSQNSTTTQGPTNAQQRADLVRKRAEWFQKQRAYPFTHIPSGALQQAIEQRNAMIQQKPSGRVLAAPPLINFPGNGLWQLTGPQPTNVPALLGSFPSLDNVGFPTVSGRVTALAVDTTDATGNTIYLGAAAGGVWKTTNGGTSWTPLTDNQPSLAVGSIAIDPNNHNTIYVGTGEDNFNLDGFYGVGILKSTDGGATWTQLGASVFAGAKSPDIGGAKIGAIAVQPGNSNVVLASVDFFDGNDPNGGVYQSLDGGVTWNRPAAGAQGAAGTDLVFDPTSVALNNAATVYAALGDVFSPGAASNGIWKSTDSGAHWTKLAGGLPAINVGRITLGYAHSTSGATATIYAAIADASTNSSLLLGLFVTTNGGTSWTKLTNTPDFCVEPGGLDGQCFYDLTVAVHPTNANFVVVGGSAYLDNSTTLFKTTDGGATWSTCSVNPCSNPSGASTASTDFTIGSTNVRPHVDTHALAFAPNGATPRLYTGDDGGVWRTDDPTPGNPLWVDLNATLAISQFYPGATPSVSDENYGFGGTQDNDIQVFSGALGWTMAPACGDGGYTAVDTTTPTTIYAGCNAFAGAKVTKSVFNGLFTPGPIPTPVPSFVSAETEITASGDTMGFIPPLAIDPQSPSDLYFGTCRIWETTSGGVSQFGSPAWSPMTGDLTNGNASVAACAVADEITSIDVSQKSFGLLLIGTSNGKVWQSSGFPIEIDNGLLPNRHITAVRSKPSDTTGNIAYVTFSGFGACAGCGSTPGHVFKTTNAMQGPLATWTNISGNLPDVPVNDIIVDHHGTIPPSDALYIATDVGVFSCPDPEAATPCTNWTVVGDGLPNSPVLSLAMRPTSRILRAATHGRSMWDIQLTDVQPTPQLAVPTLGSLTPAAVMAGSPTTNVTVTGVNFGPNTQVAVGTGQFAFIPTGMTTTFVSTTQLTVSVPSSLLTDGTVVGIGLTDPLGTSASTLPFTVMNPIPDITGVVSNISPGIVAEPVTFTLTGTGFVNGTELTINGSNAFGTASNNGKTLTVTVDGSALTAPVASPGAPVTVFNPTPGGGQAAESFKFVINANGTPEIIFNPNFVSFPALNAGGTSAAINVQLTNCVVLMAPGVCGTSGGAALILSAGSATKSGTNAGDFSVVAPTSGSPICAFAPTGTATSVAPGASCFFGVIFTPIGTTQGSRFATLTVNDDDADGEPSLFLEGEVNGPIASVSPSPIAFGSVPKGILPLPLINVTVFNFGSGTPPLAVSTVSILSSANSGDFAIAAPTNGGTACTPSAGPFPLASFVSCSFGITFNPSLINVLETATLEFTFSNGLVAKIDIPMSGTGVVPTIDTISPEIVATGGPTFALTVNGRNYVLGSVVNLNGNARLTTFVSATQLLASIPATDLTTAGSSSITVTNPAGGGTSEPKSLFVAQAPTGTNDDFAEATNTSSTPFRITQDTTQFTANTGGLADPAPACAPGTATLSGKARSAWFKFVAPASGRVVADTRYSTYNTILSVWTGTTGSFTAVACNNAAIPGTTPESFVGFNVTSGTTYFLMVTDASASGAGGTLTFRLDFASAAPANDDWANATVVPPAGTPYSNSVNSILATINTGGHADPIPLCAPAGAANGGIANSVWYSFTPASTTPVTADTLTSLDDTILSVWTGTPGAFTQVACNDNAGTGPTLVLQSQVSFTATGGTTYYFMVSSVLGDGGTAFHLNLTSLGPAASVGVAPNPVSFGSQKQGTTSAASTITVTNSGNLASTLTAGTPVTITGTNPGDFAIASGTTCVASFVLTASGGSCVIKVTFTPGAAGARTATVNVADDAPGSPQQTTLNGTGVLANVGVAPNPVPFGNQTLATTSAAQTITVTNSGNLASTLTAGTPVTITGTNPGDFAIASGTTCVASFVLTASGGSCVIKVTFTPGAAGARTATVNVADDAPGSPQQTTLNGTGVVSNVILAPNPVPFGNQKQGTTSAASTITVTNSGNLASTLTAGTPVTITGTNPADFAIASGTTCVASFVLTASGGSCVIKVTFTPGAAGARTATVNVADDAPGSPQQTTLNGTGVLANVGVAPNPVPFGNQKQGTTSAASTITVTNSGNLASTLTAGTPVTITGTNPGDFAIASGTTCVASFVLTASGGSCVIKVTFTPGAAGARTATVNVADDAPGSPQQTTLNGTGVLANVGVAPNPVPFGNQKQGTTSASSTITVTNSGTLNATLTAGTPVTITGTNPGDFAIASGTTCVASFVLTASGGSCVIKVTFTPGAAGARTATVNVADDAPGSPQQTTLNGTGVLANVGVAPNPVPFGNQTLATTSAAQTITVTNSGNLASTLTAGTPVTITGTNPGDFAIASGTTCVASFVLTASGGSCVIKVTFTPGAAGARTATVNVADDAPGSPQQTTLNGTGVVSNVILAPNPVPFGNQKQGTTSAASTITVTNNGTLNATLTAGTPVTITGTNPADFAIASGTTCVASFVLTASGGSCVIKVTFTPGAAGARTATVNVADDAPGSPQQTTLNGTGVLANVGVAPNPVPFGNQKQGTTSAASTITVTNSGTLNATLTAGTPVTITGTNPGDFAIASGTTCVASFVLTASGGSCVIKVTFTPGAAGARAATVNVADDAPGSPQQTTLNGTGVLANVGVAPNPVPFGNQKQGTTSASSTITVTNSGTLNATLTAGTPVTITGTNPGDFAIASGTTCVASFVLTANGGSCVIKVTFTPGAAGARTATVNVADDAPGSPQQTTLNGTGVLANVGVAPNPVPFGNQTLATTSAAQTITVTNSGNLASTLTAGTPVTITGTNPGDFAIASGTTCVASFVLTASGGSCVIKVTFTPGAAGARTATVNVADDAPGSPQQTTLNGTGVQSTVILNPAPVNFGNQQISATSAAQTITVTNSGNLAATLTAGTPVTITGTNPGDFAIASGTTCVASFVLTANGGSCVINVTFTPAAGGARSATVNVADNAPSSPQSVNVQGTGVQAAAITSANTTTFTVGALGTFTVTVTGSPAPTLSESGALPTGVMFTPATGVMTGTPAAGTGGTYPITFTAHNGVGADATQSFTLTVNQAAAFTSQNSASFAVGTAGTFSVVVTGFPTPTLSESGTLPGVVGFVDNGNGTGKLSGTPAAGTGGTYPITFTAHNGVGADATQNFTLTVDSLPSVATNPLSQTVNSGGSVTFTAAASGTPAPTVQWQVSVGGGVFSNVPNATSTTLTFTAAFSQNGNKYQAVFTNSVGTVTTTAATLTVVAPDLTISKSHAGNFTVGQNGMYTIKVTNNGSGPTTGTITVTDILIGTLTFVPAGSGGGAWACNATGQSVTCTSTGAIAPAGSSNFSLVVLVAPGAYPSVQNLAGVSDPNDGNPTGADKTSGVDTATVNNAKPSESSFSPSLGLVAGATSAQQITLTGAGFNSSTQVTLGSNPPLNTPLTGTANAAGTSLTVSVPAAELATANAGNLTLTVTNPGAGSVSNLSFPLVAFVAAQDASTPGTIAVTAGTPAMVKIDYTTNPATSPLPAALTVTCMVPQSLTSATCAVNGGTIAAGATTGSTTITINAIPTSSGSSTSTPWTGGRGLWPTYLLWLVATVLLSMLGMLGAVRQRTLPLRRAPAYLALVLLVLAAGALVGCTTTAKTIPTPTGPSSIMVTATTADGASVTTTVSITVSN